MSPRNSRIFPVIFLCSFASLAYEIALTRLFSISLWYHFAFMIVSIAMLGYGASGTVLSLYPRLRRLENIGVYALLLGIAFSLSYLLSNLVPFDPVKLSWDRAQLLFIGLYYLALSVPFFFTGLIIASAFSSMSERAGLLYGADLLGAGTGSMGVLLLLTAMAPEKTVFIISSIALLASILMSGGKLRVLSLFLIFVALLVFVAEPPFTRLRLSPYKGLEAALRFPGAERIGTYFSVFSRVDVFRSPAARFAPGLSLKYLEPLPEQTGLAVDGGEINAVTAAGDAPSLRFLEYLPSALPYEIGRKDDVMILDPRGGLHVLMAEHYGAKEIYKTESNPLLLRVVRDQFGVFSGGIYEKQTWPVLGRSWLRTGRKSFDLIDISLTDASPSASFGISEDYRFTVEAFAEYLDHLKPGGFISLNLYIFPPPRIELRLLNTVVSTLKELGTGDAGEHVLALRSWGSICILVKKTPVTPSEVEALRKFAESRRFDLIHYPGIREDESNRFVKMASNEYFSAFRSILSSDTRERFTDDYLFDIRPTRDNSPFFHHYLKLRNIREIYSMMGEKWQFFVEEGYILPVVFVQVLLLSLLLILLPAISGAATSTQGKEQNISSPGRGFVLLPYFAFLGIGYMLVEIVLIQKVILPLENPPYAVATVLASMLVSSGLGSIASQNSRTLQSPPAALLTAFIVLTYSLLLPLISTAIAPWSMSLKIPTVFLILLPPGFLMGIPFPAGLRILGEREAGLIPWAWAINGCLSVLAPVLTVMLAMVLGFKIVFWLGALAYAAAEVTLRLASR